MQVISTGWRAIYEDAKTQRGRMKTLKVVTGMSSKFSLVEEKLAEAGARLFYETLKTEADVIRHAQDADAVIVGPVEPYSEKAIAAMSRCRIISRFGIGYSNIDVAAATRMGIPVAVVLDASIHEVSDHTLMFILAFSRRLIPLTRMVQGGGWHQGSPELAGARGKMFRLNQQTLGLVGMGRIGELVALKAGAFGLRILVNDPYVTQEKIAEIGAVATDFENIVRESDFISLHLPLTPETNQMFGPAEFRKMKPTAYIINTSRGALIDEAALYQAITKGDIAGAGLDVTAPEPPLPDSPLLTLEQVLITAHSAWLSESSNRELQQTATEAVVKALAGDWPTNIINPEVRRQENCRVK